MGKTRGVHETTPEVRNRMVGMYEAGLGLREISTAVNCSQRTVKRWLNRFDREGNVDTRQRCGRKRATTVEQDEAIIRLASQTSITAAKAVLPALGLSCSVDTVRERLHKAGIHNWSPSRKHMQRIPLRTTDSAEIQQAVWRPTGTQHGKKKDNQISKSKKLTSGKKKVTNKSNTQSNSNFSNDNADNYHQSSEENLSSTSKAVNEVVPTQAQNIFSHSMPQLNVSQCWPLDLVQNSNEMPQRSVSSYREILNADHQQEMQTEKEQEYQNKNSKDRNCQPHYQEIMENQPQYMMNCPNPQMEQDTRMKYYTTENNERPLIDNNVNSCEAYADSETSQNGCKKSKESKKGGKVKGTLETTIEIRNRMIGMSEAGLSTLSIALAINRSERTVKRWLERWQKEGNVQTKERKGRKRITTKEEDDAIIAMATQQPLTAAKNVAPALGLKCSVDTIRERLHKAGIHSWKLGKKQGEGNAVHTIHLWQPSGNRPNKLKSTIEKNKKVVNKKLNAANNSERPVSEEKNLHDYDVNKVSCEPQKVIEESNNEITPVSYNSAAAAATTQDMHTMSMSNSNLIESQATHQLPSNTQPTAMAIIGPTVPHQTDPHCRLICPNAHSTIPCHGTTNSIYSSNAVIVNSQPVHMEHSEPINYEPYIWTF